MAEVRWNERSMVRGRSPLPAAAERAGTVVERRLPGDELALSQGAASGRPEAGGTPVQALEHATVSIGAAASLRTLAQVAVSAQHKLHGALFGAQDKEVARAIREGAPGRDETRLLVDPEMLRMGKFDRLVDRTGVELLPYDDEPTKLHAKALVADGERAVVTSAAPLKEMREDRSLDLAIQFDGEAARALDAVFAALETGDTARIQDAARTAAAHGVLINDPLHGVHILGDQIGRLIDGAQHSLLVGTKLLSDQATMAQLARAQANHVDVRTVVSVREKGKEVHAATAFGLNLDRQPRRVGRLHANVIIRDGEEAYVGTAFLHARPLGRASAARQSLEVGVLLRDPLVIARIQGALEALDALPTAKAR